MALIARGTADAPGFVDRIRAAAWEVDPGLFLYDATSLRAPLAEPLSGQRFGAAVLAGFGGFGLILAVLGTYGVLAYSVSRRVPEFGVRLALGARPAQLLLSVLRRGLALVPSGLCLGTLATLALSRVLGGSSARSARAIPRSSRPRRA